MTRVLFTHTYSMDYVRQLCERGEYPRQHLWGADALAHAGYDVEYGYFGANRPWLKGVSWRLRGKLGDLEQQGAMLRRGDQETVVYAGESSMVAGLSQLRRLGRRAPLVAVVHTADRSVRGLDVAICLSTQMRDRLVHDYGRDPETTPLGIWGPDLAFPGYGEPTTTELIVSTGKTERDTDTLLAALDQTDLRARVYVEGGRADGAGPGAAPSGSATRSDASPAVEVIPTGAGTPLPYGDVLADLRRASIVAIPLRRSDRLLGLSEIADALALAKPIVLTRTSAIDFDPSAIGCGITVEPGDVSGWRDALTQLTADPKARAEMGRVGRAYAESDYNAHTFGTTVGNAGRLATTRPRR